MKILIDEEVVKQALDALASGIDHRKRFEVCAALRSALQAEFQKDKDTWRQKAIELGLELSECQRLMQSQSDTINKLEGMLFKEQK